MTSHRVSARAWRPQTFEEVVGQPYVTQTLQNAIRQDKVAQAYLFSGIRGVGKTTLARILAKGLNCSNRLPSPPCNQCDVCLEITQGRAVDVIEIDGASNTGVDDVRELRERVKYLPMRGRYKIYIIDEVHMLSNAAFNALLKTLEEPPPHLVFILATTDPHKMPETVLSRCQHFALRRLSRQEIVTQLARVMQQKETAFTEAGLGLIARAAGGSMRDALTLLDQAVVYAGEGEGSGITEERLFALLGRMGAGRFPSLARAIQGKDAMAALSLAREISERGYDLRQFLADWMEHLRNLIVARQVPGAEAWMDLPPEEIAEIQALSVLFSPEALQRLFALFSRLQEEIRNAQDAHLLFEVALMKAILLSDLQPIETVIQRLEALEGVPRAATPPQAPSPSVPAASVLDKAAPSAYIPPIPPISPTPPIQPRPPRKVGAIPSHETFSDWVAHVRTTRPSIASYLETGTLVSVDAQKMTLGFSHDAAFVIALLQNGDNKRWLDDAVASYFQNGVSLELVTAPKVSVLPHPLVQEALSVFGGAIMAVP
jgi:DNA polymerase-3 subunit gamma/tau